MAVVCCVVVGLGVGGYFAVLRLGRQQAAAVSATSSAMSASASASASAQAEPATTAATQASGTAARNVGLPPAKPDDKATYQATIHTNRGDVVIDLLNSKATCTVNSFVYLAAKKYFNNTHCHRLTTIDPFTCCSAATRPAPAAAGQATSSTTKTWRAPSTPRARWRWRTPAPNTNGSQFFIVYKNSTLAPSYTPFGEVVKGLGIIQNVAKAGSDNANGTGDGHPKEKVVIESVTIKKT